MRTISFDEVKSFEPVEVAPQEVSTISLDQLQPDYQSYARQMAQRHGHPDPEIFVRQIQKESDFNPKAVSPKGAQGIAQFMPGTAKQMGVKNVFDPYEALEGAARYKRQLLDMFEGDDIKATAAYNAGPEAVKKYGGVPPFKETLEYVDKIHGRQPGARIVSQTEFDKPSFPASGEYSDITSLSGDLSSPMAAYRSINEWASKKTLPYQGDLIQPDPFFKLPITPNEDLTTRVIPTSAAKTAWMIGNFFPQLVAGYAQKQLERGRRVMQGGEEGERALWGLEDAITTDASAAAGEAIEGLSHFVSKPTGVSDIAAMMTGQQPVGDFRQAREAWSSDPVGSIVGASGLAGGALAARRRTPMTGEYTPGERVKLTKDSGRLDAIEGMLDTVGKTTFETPDAALGVAESLKKANIESRVVPAPGGWKVEPPMEQPEFTFDRTKFLPPPTGGGITGGGEGGFIETGITYPKTAGEPVPQPPTIVRKWDELPQLSRDIVRRQTQGALDAGKDPIVLDNNLRSRYGTSLYDIVDRPEALRTPAEKTALAARELSERRKEKLFQFTNRSYNSQIGADRAADYARDVYGIQLRGVPHETLEGKWILEPGMEGKQERTFEKEAEKALPEWKEVVSKAAEETRQEMVEELKTPLPEEEKVTIPPKSPIELRPEKEPPKIPPAGTKVMIQPTMIRGEAYYGIPEKIFDEIVDILKPMESGPTYLNASKTLRERLRAEEVRLFREHIKKNLGADALREFNKDLLGLKDVDDGSLMAYTALRSRSETLGTIPEGETLQPFDFRSLRSDVEQSKPTMAPRADGTLVEKETTRKNLPAFGKRILEQMEQGAIIKRGQDRWELVGADGEIVPTSEKALQGTIGKLSRDGILDWIPAEGRHELKEAWQTDKSVRSENPFETKEQRYRRENEVARVGSYKEAVARQLVETNESGVTHRIDQVGPTEFRIYKDPEAQRDTPDPPNTAATRMESIKDVLGGERQDIDTGEVKLYTFPGPLGDLAKSLFSKGEKVEDTKTLMSRLFTLKQNTLEKLLNGEDRYWYVSPKDPRSEQYKQGMELVARLYANKGLATFDAFEMSKSIAERLTPEERAQVHSVIEGTSKLKPSVEAAKFAEDAKGIVNAYLDRLQQFGRLEDWVQDFVPHLVYKDPEGHKMEKYVPLRSRSSIGSTIDDLVSKGYTVETDAAVWLPKYVEWAERHLANLEFFAELKKMRAPDGKPVIRSGSMVTREQRQNHDFVPANFAHRMKSWDSPIKYGDAALERQMKSLFEGDVWLHRDVFQTVDSIFTDATEATMSAFHHGQSVVKRVRMYNPMIHGWNITEQMIRGLGPQVVKWLPGFRPEEISTPEGKAKMSREYISGGGRLEGLYDIRRILGSDEFKSRFGEEKFLPKDLIDNPMMILTHPLKTISDLNTYILFDKMLKSAQLTSYTLKKQIYMEKHGLPENQAIRAAALDTNNILGTLQPYYFTKNQRSILRTIMFARDWNVSTGRTFLGALAGSEQAQAWLPKFLKMHNVLTPEMRKAMTYENRANLVRGVIGAVVFGNMIQMAMQSINGQTPTTIFQNEHGHLFDMDTGIIDLDGNRIYMRDFLFKQIDDYYQAFYARGPFKVGEAKLEPLVSTTGHLLFNTNFQREPIWGEEAGRNLPESMAAIAKEIVRIFPYEDLTGRTGHVRTTIEKALVPLGIGIRHGQFHSPELAQISKDFFKDLGRYERMSKETLGEIKDLIQTGKKEEAAERTLNAIMMRQIDPGQLGFLMKKMEAPFYYKVLNHNRFQDWLANLPERDRKKVMSTLERVPLVAEKQNK